MYGLLIWTFSGTASSGKFVTTDRCEGCMLWFLTSSTASNKLSWNQSLCRSSWLSWTVESCWNIHWAAFSVSVYQSSSSSYSPFPFLSSSPPSCHLCLLLLSHLVVFLLIQLRNLHQAFSCWCLKTYWTLYWHHDFWKPIPSQYVHCFKCTDHHFFLIGVFL